MNLRDDPLLLFALCFTALWLAAQTGAYFGRKRAKPDDSEREDLGVILSAALTLLGLIIAFSFAMATSRYDQRKNYEEAEANAIGTEHARADLLPTADAARVRRLLRSYLDQRILFYKTREAGRLNQINASTAQLQNDLWSTVQAPSVAQPTPIAALALSGMNDVLNSQGYTQAAWRNRIPVAAWILMVAVGISCNLMFGYYARHSERKNRQFLVLPLIASVAFFLIADMDSPRGGVIWVSPQNLVSLADSMRGQ